MAKHILSVAAMFALQRQTMPYLTQPIVAKNQAPMKRNGGRPTFKMNRRKQLARKGKRK